MYVVVEFTLMILAASLDPQVDPSPLILATEPKNLTWHYPPGMHAHHFPFHVEICVARCVCRNLYDLFVVCRLL